MAKLEILATAGIFDGDVAEPRNVPARAEFLYAAAGGGLLWRCYFFTTLKNFGGKRQAGRFF